MNGVYLLFMSFYVALKMKRDSCAEINCPLSITGLAGQTAADLLMKLRRQ